MEEMEKNKYSIIVPTYNERLNIALIVYLIFKHLPSAEVAIGFSFLMFEVIDARKNVNIVSTIDVDMPDWHLAALIFGSQALIVETFASRML